MTVYNVLNGVTAVQVLPSGPQVIEGSRGQANLPQGSVFVDLSPGGAGAAVAIPNAVSFHVVLRSTPNGVTCSCSVQPLGSNDGIHWTTDGSVISVSSGATPGQASGTSTAPFAYRSAQVTALSGNTAAVYCFMNA